MLPCTHEQLRALTHAPVWYIADRPTRLPKEPP